MLSYFLDYLETEAVNALLDEKLREVNDDPSSCFCTLKKRFCEHFELLQKEGKFGHEMVQHMIDILDHGKDFARVVAGNTEGPRSGLSFLCRDYLSLLLPILDKPSQMKLNGYKLDRKDDSTFLTNIRTIITEEPLYQQIVEEILQEAANSLGVKLKKLEKELLQFVGTEMTRMKRQEINERMTAERGDADRAAEARLCSLIREALHAEADHPTNR